MMRMPAQGQHHPFTAEDIVAGPTYHHLTSAVQRCIDVGVFAPGTEPSTVATSLWAAAHGAVSLCLAKPGLAGDDALLLCERVIEHSGLGAALSSYISPDTHSHDTDPHSHDGMSEGLAIAMRSLTGQVGPA